MTEIAQRVVFWYQEHGRQMDWRDTQDPYSIWLSEIIMQQTRIQTGVAYLQRFLARFPTLPALAAAKQDEVLKLWEGLGYYSRARNLHRAARQLMEEFGGNFPQAVRDLERLRGVGPYTARAIASFAYGTEVGVLDGNVMRVLSRLIGDFSPIDQQKTRKSFQALLDDWVVGADSRAFNHGMMDLGSQVCTPTQPGCLICPLEAICVARQEGTAHLLPQKGKKLVRKTRYFQFYLVRNGEGLLIRQRPAQGLWGGLWEIPNQETDLASYDAQQSAVAATYLGSGKHVFTHFDMLYQVFEGGEALAKQWPEAQFERMEKIPSFAFSRAVLNMFDHFLPGWRNVVDN